MSRSIVLPLLLSAALLLVCADSLSAAGVGGTIDSVDGHTLVLKVSKDGKSRTLQVEADAVISLDGKPVGLADLKAGWRAFVTTSDDRAIKVAARSDEPAAPATTKPQPPKRTARVSKSAQPATGGKSAGAASGGPYPWPQFLGPDRNNISTEKGLLKSWPAEGPKLLWEAKGLGAGYSSVAVAGGKVLTMGDQGNSEAILAVDLQSGKPLWMTPCGAAFQQNMGDGPRGVPTVDGDLVYALSANGDLVCCELAGGKLRWQTNILEQFGGSNIKWGISESVLVDGDRLICTPGGSRATMVALNKQNGTPIWGAATPQADSAGYASAIVADVHGVRQYIQVTSRGTIGVRAQDGTFLWEESSAANPTANCAAPVFYSDTVFSSSGYGTGGALVKLVSARGGTMASLLYQTKEMKNHHGGMIVVDGFLYGSNDPGILTCIDLKNNRVAWQNRSVGKGALACADGHIYLRSEKGPIALVEVNPTEYRETGRFEQPQRSAREAWAYPVIADGKLFLRDQDLLLCYDLRDPGLSKAP
jgi:outer membrane protein assembly factor BamB